MPQQVGEFRSGRPLSAARLNRLVQAANRAGQVAAAGPLVLSSGAGGLHLALADSPQAHFDPRQAERAHQERANRVARVLKQLDARDRRIIEGRYGLGDNLEAKTLKEVGDELGVSKERVRQLETRAMERLRELARDAQLHDALD